MNKAAEALLEALGELDRESQKLLDASRKLEEEAKFLLETVNRCFPKPQTTPKEPPTPAGWLH